MSYKTLIIDGNNLCYRQFLKMPNLSFKSQNTSVIYGTLKKIAELNREFAPKYIIFAWDHRESLRKKDCTSYKANRKEKGKEFDTLFEQMELLHKKILPTLQINSFKKAGMEGDDIIAILCQNQKLDKQLVCSSDTDLLQLLIPDSVDIYNWKEVINTDLFFDQYGFESDCYAMYKSIVGDASDNIKGIHKIGPKGAMKLLHESGYKTKTLLAMLHKKQNEQFRESYKLIQIPYAGIKKSEIINIHKTILNGFAPKEDDIINVLYKYNISSIKTKELMGKWKK